MKNYAHLLLSVLYPTCEWIGSLVTHTQIWPIGLKWGSPALKDKANEQIKFMW